MKLTASEHIEAPAYACLKDAGFDVTIIDSVCGRAMAVAKKGDIELVGYSMLELLGLVALSQTRGENWQATKLQKADYSKLFG